MVKTLKKRIFDVIESPDPEDWRGRSFDDFMIVLIVFNITAVILETVESLASSYGTLFLYFEYFSITVFTVEYILRIWTANEIDDERFQAPIKGRIRFAMMPLSLIDAIAILPFYLGMFVSVDLRFMRVFRLLRLLKLTRYSVALQMLGSAVYAQRRALWATLIIILMLLVFASSIIYLLEKDIQPEAFSSIPQAMWWGLTTLTTVGYGDVTPVSVGGRIFGGFIMVLGIGMFALPAGILASAFSTEIRKREFVVNWNMVASVPLFSQLDALRISEIVALLELKIMAPRSTIVTKGDRANAMYFISVGEVQVDIKPEPKLLKAGDYFGEIALLKDTVRTATVTAVTECQLMVLNVKAFKHILAVHPDLREKMIGVMKQRLIELQKSGAQD